MALLTVGNHNIITAPSYGTGNNIFSCVKVEIANNFCGSTTKSDILFLAPPQIDSCNMHFITKEFPKNNLCLIDQLMIFVTIAFLSHLVFKQKLL